MPALETREAVLLPFSREGSIQRPILVVAGLHQAVGGTSMCSSIRERVLTNCGTLLARARAQVFPIAFARYVSIEKSPSTRLYPAWVPGFEPTRQDMIFDVFDASFYANTEFAGMIGYSGGRFALAGLFAELDCLSTAIEAQQRGQHVTLIADAFACDPPPGISDDSLHRATTAHIALHGAISTTDQWIAKAAELPATRKDTVRRN